MGEFAKETINSVIDQLNMYYLCKKKKDYCYSSEEIEQYYYSIFMSLPPEYQRKIKNDTYQESDVDWEFIEKMAKVIQEPIIKQRLLEMIENK